jgi:hypothetical protein
MGWLADWRERRQGRKLLRNEQFSNSLTPEQREFWKEDRSKVNLDQDVIPLNDTQDATSLLMTLAMQGHMVSMSQNENSDTWLVTIEGDEREWVHQHQIIALARALKDVQNDDKEGTT